MKVTTSGAAHALAPEAAFAQRLTRARRAGDQVSPLAAGLLGATAAGAVGYLTSLNRHASPPHAAVALRVSIILALIVAALLAQASLSRRRMANLLMFAGLFSCVWLLNGSGDSLSFSLGVLVSGLAPGVLCYVMLAYPLGRPGSRLERRFIVASAGAMAAGWLPLVLASAQPALSTPLVGCAPHCPHNVFHLGFAGAGDMLPALVRADWLLIAAGTALLLLRRIHLASAPLRLLQSPMAGVAVGSALLLIAYTASNDANDANLLGALYVGSLLAIPLAIFAGLAMERLFMGEALAGFLTTLERRPRVNVERALAHAVRDPSLRIYYRRRGSDAYVSADGAPFRARELSPDREQSYISAGGDPLAIVGFDANLSRRFIQAAGKSALLWIENERLAADLTATVRDLTESRRRLSEAADLERRRIQRDLHDGAQQHLVAMHVKLGLALDAMAADPDRSATLLAELDGEIGETLKALRTLSSGVFPPVMAQYGLVHALRSELRQMPIPVSIEASGVGRYPPHVETAVYFCCLEALQNVGKHAGHDANATLRLWEKDEQLGFALCDFGAGFDRDGTLAGHGLQNMSDRLESVGGRLMVQSRRGAGTTVTGLISLGDDRLGSSADEPPAHAPV